MKRTILFATAIFLLASTLNAKVTIPFYVPAPTVKGFVSAKSENECPLIYEKPDFSSNVLWSYCIEDCEFDWQPQSWNREKGNYDASSWDICRMYDEGTYLYKSKKGNWTEIESPGGSAWVPTDNIRQVETYGLSKKQITDKEDILCLEEGDGLYVVTYGDGGWPFLFQEYLIGKYVDGYVVYPYSCKVERNYESDHPGILNGVVGNSGLEKFTRRDLDYLLAHAEKSDKPTVQYGYFDPRGIKLTSFCTVDPESPMEGILKDFLDEGPVVNRSLTTVSSKPTEEPIYKAVETLPQFPGGEAAIYKHLALNMRYPEAAKQNDEQGRVIVSFVIEKDGSVGNVEIHKGVCKDLDREAIRVVKTLPNFTSPAKIDDRPVRYRMNLPITFKL